jgi:predicted nucleic acid-binding protein
VDPDPIVIPSPEVLVCDTSFLGHAENARHRPSLYQHWDREMLDRISRAILAITPFTLAEVRFGYRAKGFGAARVAAIENNLRSFLLIPLDEQALETYVDLKVELRHAGRALGFHDCWIAAVAISQGRPLISCDRGHEDLPSLETIYLPPPTSM